MHERDERPGSLRQMVRDLRPGPRGSLRADLGEAGAYPLVVITMLNTVDELDRAVVSVLAPNIRRYFDINNATLGGIIGAQAVMLLLASVPIGYLGTRWNRARILRWSALTWGVLSAATALAVRLPLFVLARVGTGLGKASVDPIGKSLLTDHYPPTSWNRVLSIHSAANPMGYLIGPLIAGGAGLLVTGDGVWRVALVAVSVPTLIALALSLRLREPASQMVRTVQAETLSISGAPSDLGFFAACRRLLAIKTFQRMIVGIGVLGFALVGVGAFSSVLWEEEFGIGEAGRGLIAAIVATGMLLGNLVGGRVGDRGFRENPAQLVRLIGRAVVVFSLLLTAAVLMPRIWLAVAALWMATVVVGSVIPPLAAVLGAVCEPKLRPLIYALLGLLLAVIGGVVGAVLIGALADATSMRTALAAVMPTGVIGGVLMTSGAVTVQHDLAVVEEAVRSDLGSATPAS